MVPVLFALVAACSIALGSAPGPARADNALTVNGTPTVDNKFPTEVQFSIDATSSAGDINDATLHYQLLPSNVGVSARAEFDTGKIVHAVYHLRTAGNPLYVPPTKTIRYYWTLQDASGNQTKTDPVDWSYDDTRFKFKKASNGNLTLYYYTGSDANAQRILAVGRGALDKASALNGAPLDFPIHLVTYGNQAEAGAAFSHESKSFDPSILGQADPPDIVVLVAGDLSGAENEDTVRHELTHLVNARAVQGPSGQTSPTFPLWLDEGLAVNSQNDPGGFQNSVQDAIRRDSVVQLRNLTGGFRGSNSDLFYGESWSITHFLVTTYGPDNMAQLLAAFKAGQSEDAAFTKAYGLDRDGIYNAWRKSVGLNAVPASGARPPAAPSQAPASNQGSSPAPPAPNQGGVGPISEPSVSPPANPTRTANKSSSSDDTLPIVLLGVAGGALFLALIVAAVFGGLALSRRGRS